MVSLSLPGVILLVLAGLGCVFAKDPETNPEYLGCYRDDKKVGISNYITEQRALPFEIKQFTDKRDCINQCYGSGYKYAGLQNGDLCFCGQDYNKYGRLDDTSCNIECRKPQDDELKITKNFFESCGGRWANSVYSVVGFEYEQAKSNLRKSWLYN